MYIDLTHPLTTGMPIYPDDPIPAFEDFPSGPPWRLTQLRLGSHSGTHIDAASHYIPDGRTIEAYPLERCVLSGHVIRIRGLDGAGAIGWQEVVEQLPADIAGTAVVFDTGWALHWGSECYFRHPYLSEETCRELVALGVGLVGTDALNVDDTAAGGTHAHRILLGADVLIVENLADLRRLQPMRRYGFSFAPLLLPGVDGSPVRAYAWEE